MSRNDVICLNFLFRLGFTIKDNQDKVFPESVVRAKFGSGTKLPPMLKKLFN